MKTPKLKVQLEWLLLAKQIKDREQRELFLYTCFGKALSFPIYKDVQGFVWPEVQKLWERTIIVPVTDTKNGFIELV